MAYFNLSRMEEVGGRARTGPGACSSQTDDRSGTMAVTSLLCLVKPTDPRVERWLAEALEYADATGDRSKQLNTLTTLAWNHFLRSFYGRAQDMAEAEGFGRRLAGLAEELGAHELAVQGWSLLTVMARLSGRLAEAAAHAAVLQRATGDLAPPSSLARPGGDASRSPWPTGPPIRCRRCPPRPLPIPWSAWPRTSSKRN